jgi:hypothetical protein
MLKMGLVCAMILCLAALGKVTGAGDSDKSASQMDIAFDPIPISGIPIRIENAVLEDKDTSRVKYRFTNLSGETITTIKLRILFFDREGKYERVEEQLDVIEAPPRSTAGGFFYLNNEIVDGNRLAIVIQEAVGASGVWSVDPQASEEMAKAHIMGRPFQAPAAQYSANQTVTDADKAEICRDALDQVLRRKELSAVFSLENKKELFLSKENINFNFSPKMPRLVLLEPDEIQMTANQLGVVMFLRFGGIEPRGADVHVTLEYLKRVGPGKLFTPCCGGYVFFYRKESGTWTGRYIDSYRIL